MNEYLKNKLHDFGDDRISKYNYLREYLQLLILKIIDEYGYFRHVSFVGGTALRVLYDLNRFSEDLDFSLVNKKGFYFKSVIDRIKKELVIQNYKIEITAKDNKTVASSFIRFEHLLFELGLSPHKDQKLSIKLEVDCNPPAGFNTELSVINKEFLISINHHDLPSLFSGKLHAFLFRNYAKGRDYYDLLWFIGKKIIPNFEMLKNAIKQTQHVSLKLDYDKTIELLKEKIIKTDFKKIKNDVEPFLADPKELRYFEKNYFLKLLSNARQDETLGKA